MKAKWNVLKDNTGDNKIDCQGTGEMVQEVGCLPSKWPTSVLISGIIYGTLSITRSHS